jgi:hypothetical protein
MAKAYAATRRPEGYQSVKKIFNEIRDRASDPDD